MLQDSTSMVTLKLDQQHSFWPTDAHTLPFFKDVSASDRENLFIRKLQLCSIVFDFSDTLKHVREKEIKRQMLLEMVNFVQSGLGSLTDPIHQHLIQMVSDNIFRCLPPTSHGSTRPVVGADPDEDDSYLEPAWPHLEIIYELLLRYIVSSNTDVKLAKRYIDHSFVTRLFYLFDSEDHREREYLKTILHRIYGKFMVYRPFIRKGISNVFSHFILTEKHNGIGELLEIFGTIINGFSLPMKDEHKSFLVRALIPLHKPKSLASYHQQLSYCVTQYVEKDCKLADTVIKGLLKYWPVSGYQKEILFLAELQEVLLLTEPEEFQRCMAPLSRKIGRCVTSSHFQVAEYALFFWNNHHIVTLMAHNRNVIFPIIYGALEKNSQSHWNQTVQQLTNNVMTMLIEMDNQLFEECRRQYLEKETRAECLEQQRELTWKRLEEIAEQQQRELR